MTYLIGVFMVISDQRKVERKVAADSFESLEKLDEVLSHPAGLVSFTKFMEDEFYEELLVFYRALIFTCFENSDAMILYGPTVLLSTPPPI